MALTTVGIVFEVINRGTANLTSIERSVTTFGRSLKSLAVTTLGLAGIGSIGYALQKTAKDIGEIGHVSEKLGTTTEGLTALQYSARRVGLDAETANRSLQAMTRQLSEAATGAGEARFAFAELGLNARQLSKGDSVQAFYAIADAMAKVTTQGDRLRLAYDIFGRGQSEILDLLAGGSAALKAQAEEGRKLGLVLTRIDVDTVRAANLELGKLKGIVTGVLYRAVIELAPYVEAIAGELTDAATAGEGFGHRVTDAFETAAMAAAKVLSILEKIHKVDFSYQLGDVEYTARFQQETIKATRDAYEFEMQREGRQAWTRPVHVRATAAEPERYERIYREVTEKFAPFYQSPYPTGAAGGAEREVETFFEDIRRRAANTQARRKLPAISTALDAFYGYPSPAAARGEETTDGLKSELSALDDVLNKLRLESEIRGENVAQRQLALALDKASAAAQEDYNKGLRKTEGPTLTGVEKANIEQFVLSEAQKDFNAEIELTVSAMRQEANLAGMTNKERERETVIQNAVNDAMKRGVELTAAQREELTKVVDQLQRARDLADMTFGQGWSLGIKQMQEELLTTGQIAQNLAVQMRDGIVGSLTDAIFRSEDLGDSLRRVGLEMLEYAMREAWLKPMVTQGMGFGTQLLGKLPGLAASLFPAGAPAGGSGGMTIGGFDKTGLIPRAGGGRVSPGTAYWVGEQGPEPFIPDEAGTILPTGVRRGMGRGGLDIGRIEALLGQMLGLLAQRQKIDATIVDGRDLLTRGDMKGREGEELVMYHQSRNGG